MQHFNYDCTTIYPFNEIARILMQEILNLIFCFDKGYSVLGISISRMQNRYMHKRKEKIFDEFVLSSLLKDGCIRNS